MSAHTDVAIEIDSEIPSSSQAAQMCSRFEQVWSESGADTEQMNTRALRSSRGSNVDD